MRPQLDRLHRREGVPVDPFGDDDPLLDPVHGDFGLTALRRAALAAGDPTVDGESDLAVAHRYGATVLGPVLTGFADWVVHRAAARGVPVVFCPMREGELLAELIDRAARARNLPVTARPIWLSRQVASAAAIEAVTIESITAFLSWRYGMTGRTAAAALGLSADDPVVPAGLRDRILDDPAAVGELAAAIVADEAAQARVVAAATRVRTGLLRHLADEGFFDVDRPVLVDLGWGGTIQHGLAEVLRIAGRPARPAGLYLATGPRSAEVVRSGLQVEGYLGESGVPVAVLGPVLRSPEVLEQAVTALCGSLIDVADDGRPVLGPAGGSPTQDDQRRAVQDGIRSFQQRWADTVAAGVPAPDLSGARARLGAVLAGSIVAPTPDEARVLSGWLHDDNFGSDVVTPVVPEVLAEMVGHLSPADVGELSVREVFWPGALAAADPLLAVTTGMLARGDGPAAVFDLDAEVGRIAVRTIGPDGRGAAERFSPIRINHHGRSWLRVEFAGPATAVELRPTRIPTILRIDRVVVDGGAAEPADAAVAAIGPHRCGAGTYLFDGHRSVLRVAVTGPGGRPVGAGRITVAFAVLPGGSAEGPARLGARIGRMGRVVRDELRHGGLRAALRRARKV